MSTTSYIKLFSVTLKHTYFDNGFSKGLTIAPTKETALIFERFKLLIKPLASGIEVYIMQQDNTTAFLKNLIEISANGSFSFKLQTLDGDFYNYTDLPINWNGSINYSTRNVANSGTPTGLLLNPDYSSEQLIGSFGKIRIHLTNLITSVDKNEIPSYIIQFNSRKTQWCYYIVNNGNLDLNNIAIQSNPPIAFTPVEKTQIPSGEVAYVISSGAHLLPMQQTSKYSIDLVKRNIDGTAPNASSNFTTILRLPTPNPSSMSVEIPDGASFVTSPMYIYL